MVDDAVSKYIKISSAISRLLCRKYGVKYPLQPRHSKMCGQTGILNRNIEFEYHGIGCLFTIIDSDRCRYPEIDVDYLEDRIILDPWKISQFDNSVDIGYISKEAAKRGSRLVNPIIKLGLTGVVFWR